jgi:hypothetical protein
MAERNVFSFEFHPSVAEFAVPKKAYLAARPGASFGYIAKTRTNGSLRAALAMTKTHPFCKPQLANHGRRPAFSQLELVTPLVIRISSPSMTRRKFAS